MRNDSLFEKSWLDLDEDFDAAISFSVMFHQTQDHLRLQFPIQRTLTKKGGVVFFASGA